MKRIVAILLVICAVLSGCAANRTDITPDEIAAAYAEAGYEVSSHAYDEKIDFGLIGYVRADHPNGNYIYFSIFETEAEAQAYKKEYYHPAVTGLFSVIFGQPSWQRWEVHGNIVVQYDEPSFYKIFQNLLKEK